MFKQLVIMAWKFVIGSLSILITSRFSTRPVTFTTILPLPILRTTRFPFEHLVFNFFMALSS